MQWAMRWLLMVLLAALSGCTASPLSLPPRLAPDAGDRLEQLVDEQEAIVDDMTTALSEVAP